MRRILRICVISLSIIFLVLGVKFNKACAQQWEYVPQQIRQLVFEQSRFSLPITFQLPCSDDPSTKERVLEEWRKPTQPSFPPREPQNASLINESFLHFLIENKFAKVDKFVMGRGTKYMREYKILSYSDTIKPHIIKGDFENDKFHIILAVRTLKSIDYTNEYEATPDGFKINFFAITFTYTLNDIFPNLPKTTKQFSGEARAFLDPDDGKWKLDKFSLEDQDSNEYMTLLRVQYNIFVKKQQEKFIASGLSFRYGNNSVLFSFQFEGGKPPYKYGKLTLNGRTYEEVFKSYIEAKQSTIVTFMTERNLLYRIDFHQLEKEGGGFTIFIGKNWPFGWPPDISFPLRVKLTIFDSASPPKSAYVDTIVYSGTILSIIEKLMPPSGLHFAEEKLRVWIEKDGKKLENEDTPKIVSSLYSGTDSIKEGEIIYKPDEQIALCVVQGGTSIEKVREELIRFLNETSDEVLAMGAKKDERINQVFIVSEKEFTDMVKSIYESDKEMVVRLLSSTNVIKGEPIVAYFTFQENKNE